MMELSYRRHRFPPVVIQHAVWLYLRFTLSYRDVEDLLAERGLDISYETVRSWVLKFGPVIARRLQRRRPRPSDRWHLDEMVVRIAGKRMYLWRAVDHEGEVLDMLVQSRRDSRAALRATTPARHDLGMLVGTLRRQLIKELRFAHDSPLGGKWIRTFGPAKVTCLKRGLYITGSSSTSTRALPPAERGAARFGGGDGSEHLLWRRIRDAAACVAG
jgi:hypothetical protein